MKDKELNAFLASVRRTRFVDYLDPLGETAQNAFERRLSWARVSQHDPAYADEARFLLDNAEQLREVLRRELEEDDWVEEVDVGREWDTTRSQPRPSRLRENDRITEIYQADEIDAGPSAQNRSQVRPGGGKGGAPSRTPPPRQPVSRAVVVSEATEEHRAVGGGSPWSPSDRYDRNQRSREPAPPPRRVDARSTGAPAPKAGPPPVRPGGRTSTIPPVQRQPASRPPMSDMDRSGTRPAVDPDRSGSRPAELGSRAPMSRPPAAPPSVKATPATAQRSSPPPRSVPPPARNGNSGSLPAQTRSSSQGPAPGRLGGPSSMRTPAGASTSRAASRPGVGGRRGETAERAEFAPRMAEPRGGRADRAAALRAMAEDEETAGMLGAEVELEDWDPPDEPITGIMRLEDVTGPPMKPILPISAQDVTVALPSHSLLIDDGATAPSLPTRMRRPGSPGGGPTEIRRPTTGTMSGVKPSIEGTPPAPRRRRRWVGLLAMLMLLMLAGGGLAGAGVVAVPFAMSSEWLADLMDDLRGSSEPAPVPPGPKSASAGDPSKGAKDTKAAQTGGASALPSTAKAGDPKAEQKATTPTAAPEPAKAAAPEPSVAAKAAVKEEPKTTETPSSSVPPADVRGLWVGSTTTGMSFKLTVLGQTEGDFEGTVEIQLEDGTFDSLAVNGKVDGNGAMTFKGGGAAFKAAVAGRRASGSYTLKSGAKASWTAVH